MIQTKFPSGFRIDNIYDKTRLVQIRTPESNIDFTYLCGTKVGSVTNGTDSIGYGYDGKLVTSETLNGTLNQGLSYTYNNDFNLESFTYAGQTTNYTYDNDGLLTGSGPFTVMRNPGNGLPETVSDGVFSLSRTFNGYGEVEAQSHVAGTYNVCSWSLGRDRTGRITSKSETVNGVVENYAYTYDDAGRLETVTKDGVPVEEYAHDISGTRIFERNDLRGIVGRTFIYSDEDHLLSAGDTAYQYNVDGFLSSKTKGAEVTTYSYSSRGELLSVSLPDSRIIEYIHDPLGRRIAKKVKGVTVEKYLWFGLTRLLAVYDGSDSLKIRFEHADPRMPVTATMAGVMYYLAYDQVGSLRVVADNAGNLVKEVQYDSFGNLIFDSNPAFEISFGFAGGLYDKDTGLVHFGYRDYDPDTGRWTAKDPIFFSGGDTDLYGYVKNNPVNWVDPTGLSDLDLTRPGSFESEAAALITSPPNTFTVASHGNTLGFSNQQGRFVTPRQLAEMIRRHPNYHLGMTVRLDSCDTGLSPREGRPSPGQRLANELGTDVLAPNTLVWFDLTGNPKVYNPLPTNPDLPDYSHPGNYIRFTPQTGGW